MKISTKILLLMLLSSCFFTFVYAQSDETDILTFYIPEQTREPSIDPLGHRVSVEVTQYTDMTDLTPVWTLSSGATSDPISGTRGDWSGSKVITVTAEDGITQQEWTVDVGNAGGNHENDILTFDVSGQTGPAIIDTENHTILVEVTAGTNLFSISPTWTVSDGASSNPVSGTPGNYTEIYLITVYSEIGVGQDWNILIYDESEVPSAETDIISFSSSAQVQPAVIDAEAHTIWIELLYGTDPTNIYASWDVSAGATSSPVSGSITDFSSPVTIIVTAENGISQQEWTVTVEVEATPFTDILTFYIPEQTREPSINPYSHRVSVEVAQNADLTDLTPEWTLSPGATSDPVSGTTGDWSNQRVINVTAEDGYTSQEWTVDVGNASGNNENDILTFDVTGQTGPATIDTENHTVLVEVSAGTNLISIAPTWTVSDGASSNPVSGTSGNYTEIYLITVYSEIGVGQDWSVRIYDEEDVLKNETDILSFITAEQVQPGTIDPENHTIWIELLYGTDASVIRPTWTLSEGATSIPVSGSQGDYTNPYTISVTAEDGLTTQNWTVTTEVEATPLTDILTFYIPEQTREPSINPFTHTVSVEVTQNADLTDLTPEWTLSPGATSDPVSGTTGDWSNQRVINVTAEDGYTSQEWTVDVGNASGNNENDILTFDVTGQTGPATIDTENHTVLVEVTAGTNLISIAPTWTVSDGASSNPVSGTPGNYTEIYLITVYSEIGVGQDWSILIYDESEVPSGGTDIISFYSSAQVQPATIDAEANTVWIELFYGTDPANIYASWDVSAGATSDPASGSITDFSSPVTIIVTAEDGITQQEWTVTAELEATPLTDILTFYLPEQITEPDIDSRYHRIDVTVAQNQNLDNLTPEWTLSAGATSDPVSGTVGDYNEAKTITVIAEDNYTTQDWIVNVINTSGNYENDILTFTIDGQTAPARIDSENHTVFVEVAEGSILSALRANWTLSAGAGSDPLSGSVGNYTEVYTITVIAQNGFRQDWLVRAYEEGTILSQETDILSFNIQHQTGPAVIDDETHTIMVEVAEGTYIESTAPTWTLSEGATSVPESGTDGDYSQPYNITVFAEDLSIKQDWTVYVNENQGQQTDILSFSVPEETQPASINALTHTVSAKVAFGTDLTGLVPSWTLSPGATSDPESGTLGNYSSPFIIKVISENTTFTQDWTVNVTIEASSANDILSFTVPEQNSQTIINEEHHSILLRVIEGTDLENLTPTWVISDGATSNPVSGTTGDYSDLVLITVTAENGDEQEWRIRIIEEGTVFNDETDILTFSVPEETGPAIIDTNNHSIHVEVEYGTNIHELTPTWTLSDSATSEPVSGTTGNYSTPYTIIVYAELIYISQEWRVYVTEAPSNETDILSFSIPEETGPAVINTVNHTVVVEVDYGTDLTSLLPSWTLSEGANSNPESGTEGDYSSPYVIQVTAENGTTIENWTVNVSIGPNTANDILTFTVAGQINPSAINTDNHTVLVEMPTGTDLTNIAPDWTMSDGATSTPLSGTTGDYSKVVSIIVKAESGDEQEWRVLVFEEGAVYNEETDILTFSLTEQTGPAVIDTDNHTVSIEVLYGTDVAALAPTWTLSDGAISDPDSDTMDDYGAPYTIIVYAENISISQEWTVYVSEEPNVETDILSFRIPEETAPATINTVEHTVSIEVVYGTNLTSLVPEWTLSDGASSNPASGTEGDYSNPYIIEVTAEDGTTKQNWSVNVVEAANDATDILNFSVPEETGWATINTVEHTVFVEVVFGTDLTSLIPTWTLSYGASSDPVSGTEGDYSNPYVIEVTAGDGTTKQNWTVYVSEGLNSATDILSFSIPEETGPATIDATNHTIIAVVKNGAALGALTPIWTLSDGATSDPASGTTGDYSSTVTILVTAENGDEQEWNITVTITTGLFDHADINKKIRIYPNPTDGVLHIDAEVPYSNMIIYDLVGNKIKEIMQNNISNFDCSDLKSGVYIISLFNGNEHLGNFRLIKN